MTEQSGRKLTVLRRRPVVLIVHQEDALRALMRLSVEAEGYVALEARTAAEALAVCERSAKEVDLVVTDLSETGIATYVEAPIPSATAAPVRARIEPRVSARRRSARRRLAGASLPERR